MSDKEVKAGCPDDTSIAALVELTPYGGYQVSRPSDQQSIDFNIIHAVAASMNNTRDVNEAITRFVHTVTDLFNAEAGAVRLVGADGQYHMVASLGLSDEVVYAERVLPSHDCQCAMVNRSRPISFVDSISACEKRIHQTFIDEGVPYSMIVVAITRNLKNYGVFNLWFHSDQFPTCERYRQILIFLGRFLGLTIEKMHLDEETEQLSIIEERNRMANELHDSLAQTMASMRFQVRVLDDTLHEGNEERLWSLLEKIENSLDEANTELRELIAHFRAPIDGGGVVVGVERSVERFKQVCDIPIFFQKDWPKRRVPSEYELQIVRIVQECLANIRKHSQAKTVRVLLQGRDNGEYRVLVEDDGVGLPERIRAGSQAGEHIGLSIMRDRARRMRGELTIDSEPGEGTRIELRFTLPPLKAGAADNND